MSTTTSNSVQRDRARFSAVPGALYGQNFFAGPTRKSARAILSGPSREARRRLDGRDRTPDAGAAPPGMCAENADLVVFSASAENTPVSRPFQGRCTGRIFSPAQLENPLGLFCRVPPEKHDGAWMVGIGPRTPAQRRRECAPKVRT